MNETPAEPRTTRFARHNEYLRMAAVAGALLCALLLPAGGSAATRLTAAPSGHGGVQSAPQVPDLSGAGAAGTEGESRATLTASEKAARELAKVEHRRIPVTFKALSPTGRVRVEKWMGGSLVHMHAAYRLRAPSLYCDLPDPACQELCLLFELEYCPGGQLISGLVSGQFPDVVQYPTAEPSPPDDGGQSIAAGFTTDDVSTDAGDMVGVSPAVAAEVAAGIITVSQAAALPGAHACHGAYYHKRVLLGHALRWGYKVTCTEDVSFNLFYANLTSPAGTLQQSGNDASLTVSKSARSGGTYLESKNFSHTIFQQFSILAPWEWLPTPFVLLHCFGEFTDELSCTDTSRVFR